MESTRKLKIAMLAATSLLTTALALAPANAGVLDAAAFPATIEAPIVAHSSDQVDRDNTPAKRAALIAVALGALGWLVKLLSSKKMLRVVEKTVQASLKVSADGAKSVLRVTRSPLQAFAWIAGFILFAMVGIGLYDIEWTGGLIVGCSLTGIAAFSTLRAREKRLLQLVPVKRKQPIRKN